MMTIEFNHTIVHSHDKDKSARGGNRREIRLSES